MKTLRLTWSDEALDDAERLTNHPQMYRSGRAPDTREAVVHPNYLIIYRVEEHEVVIANVVHARQQYP